MIGIFGGTFDPIHYGHLRSAVEVEDIFGLTEIRFIPGANPPHREQPVALAAQRMQMLELAIKNRPGLIADARELDREGYSYTVDTLKSLRREFPRLPLLLFIGSDAYNNLTAWHQWRQLFDYAHVVVMTRPGCRRQELDELFKVTQAKEIKELAQNAAGKLFFQRITQLDISATAIRTMIAEKKNPAFLLPDAVIEYIKQHKLYERH
ncbi:putative nicotinate-nucleotide adenylyltransferase [Candidatus Methylobacter favarea]|uniref:Probable nicotinate-nucleotide adenylyltransferase n=1 Tax=Candidatus Methylobacter favarea TaxID=2707345 RepID=A0A8S0X7M3_9GAMM|nr:nicotinate-nucleotide adenylyltransferase [Candidatus Methylobacter favarea]CAA9890207.1 putative nicotinate-nucleotide adenylyltransferase [Candidatus Methylobacter favarea]